MRLIKRSANALLIAMALAISPVFAVCLAQGQTVALGEPTLRETAIYNGDNAVLYPQLEGLANATVQSEINDAIVEKANIAQRLVTLSTLQAGGSGLQVTYGAYLGGGILSLAFDARGVMENGRNGQAYAAMGFHLDTGEPLTLSDLFYDPASAIIYMEETLLATYLDELGSYVENTSITPLPVESFSLDQTGITFYYEQSQFSLVTGECVAVEFHYSELSDFLRQEQDTLPAKFAVIPEQLKDAQIKAAVAYAVSGGSLPDIPARLGENMAQVLEENPLLREPDQYPGGRYCQLKTPVYRGVLLMTDALTAQYDHSVVQGILSYRTNLFGLQTGRTAQARWREVLGAPDSTVLFDQGLAGSYGLPVGTADYYNLDGGQLMLYADQTGILYAVRLTQT